VRAGLALTDQQVPGLRHRR